MVNAGDPTPIAGGRAFGEDDAPADPARSVAAFDAPLGPLLKLTLINALLTIVTAGIYRFWARTTVRRYLWSHIKILDTPLEYTGTGAELFVGFLIALVVVIVPFGLATTVPVLLGWGEESQASITFFVYLVFAYLAGVALFRARRYRLSRTRWRGIRAGMTGRGWAYGWTFLWTTVPVGLTLSWMVPWRNVKLWRGLVEHTRFGDRPLRFTGSSRGLYGRFAWFWFSPVGASFVAAATAAAFLTTATPAPTTAFAIGSIVGQIAPLVILLPLVVLAYAWYKVKELRRLVHGIRFAGARFSFEPTAGQLLRLAIPNLALTVLSLGLAQPVAHWRYVAFACRHLRSHGDIDWPMVAQSTLEAPRSGEGLTDAFDVGGAI